LLLIIDNASPRAREKRSLINQGSKKIDSEDSEDTEG